MNIRKQRGVSLLEVLIALVVVTIGLLGFAAMQGTAVQNSQNSHHSTLASTLAYDAFDRMRAGQSAADVTTFLESAPVQARFPGQLTVGVTSTPTPDGDLTTIDLSWDDERVGVQGNALVSDNAITVTSLL